MEKDAMRFYFLQDWESKKGKGGQDYAKQKREIDFLKMQRIHLGPD